MSLWVNTRVNGLCGVCHDSSVSLFYQLNVVGWNLGVGVVAESCLDLDGDVQDVVFPIDPTFRTGEQALRHSCLLLQAQLFCRKEYGMVGSSQNMLQLLHLSFGYKCVGLLPAFGEVPCFVCLETIDGGEGQHDVHEVVLLGMDEDASGEEDVFNDTAVAALVDVGLGLAGDVCLVAHLLQLGADGAFVGRLTFGNVPLSTADVCRCIAVQGRYFYKNAASLM